MLFIKYEDVASLDVQSLSFSLSLSVFHSLSYPSLPPFFPPSPFLYLSSFLPPLSSFQLKELMSPDTLSCWAIWSSNHKKLASLIHSKTAKSSKGFKIGVCGGDFLEEMSHPLFSILALERVPGECHWTPNLTFQWYLIWE